MMDFWNGSKLMGLGALPTAVMQNRSMKSMCFAAIASS